MRVFFRDPPSDVSPLSLPNVQDEFWDEEDREREPSLREVVRQDVVRAVAYPTVGHPDVLQVFLSMPSSVDDLLFACTLISGERLHALVESQGYVVEGFALQVAPGMRLTLEGVRAAVQVWVERCFVDVAPPEVVVDLWTDADGIPEDMLRLLLAPTVGERVQSAPTEVKPDPDVADPPYEDVA